MINKNIKRIGAWQVPKILNHYRYRLGFVVNKNGKGRILFVCLNPSTASRDTTDTTVDVFCTAFARNNGFKELEIVNIFAYRSKDKKKLLGENIDSIGPDNNKHILKSINEADAIVVAYGKYFHDRIKDRADEVFKMIKSKAKCPIYVIAWNRDGTPAHPLYKNTKKPLIPISEEPILISS